MCSEAMEPIHGHQAGRRISFAREGKWDAQSMDFAISDRNVAK